jgi:hypothetical protein
VSPEEVVLIAQVSDRFSFASTAGGLAVVCISVIALLSSRALDAGTLREIGPGLFPVALAVLLLGLGVAVTVQGLRSSDGTAFLHRDVLRPMVFILGAIIVFGFTIRPLGIVVAAPLALLLGGLASHETRWREFLPFALGLTVFCTVLFRFLLSLPIPLAPWWAGY